VEVLSQSQIDDLLNSISSGETTADEMSEGVAGKRVREYDFKSPKRFTKEQLKLITSVYENYARHLSSYLTSMLRLYVNVECVGIEEVRYSEFNNALPDSVMTGLGELRFSGSGEDNNMVMLDISKPISFSIIERLLGGTGDGLDVERDYTEIELSLMDSIFKGIFPQMSDAWANHFEVDVIYRKMETNARLMQSISHDEIVTVLMLDLQIKDVQGSISICIPAVCLEEVVKKIDSQNTRGLRRLQSATDKERRDLVMKYLHESNLELKCVIGRTSVNLSDIVYLNVGDVLQLGKPTSSMAEVCVGDSVWFKGKMGVQRGKKSHASC
jgi:flagellar motor switch protein FliM